MKTIIALLCFSLLAYSARTADAAVTFFQKSGRVGEKLEVTVSPSLDTRSSNRKETNVFSQGGVFKTNVTYELQLKLTRQGETSPKTVWSREFTYSDFGPAIPSDFKIIDAAIVSSNRFIVIFKERTLTYAQSIVEAPQSPSHTNNLPQLIYQDDGVFGRMVVSGALIMTNADLGFLELQFLNKQTAKWSVSNGRFEPESQPPADKPRLVPPLPPKLE